MFSVIIPLFNKEQSITTTLESVLKQSFSEFEVVIINDGSTDNSVSKVECFNDKRIQLRHQKNSGVSAARNKGIEEAKYDWIVFLDADDIWMENHLSSLKEMITKFETYSVFCTSYTKANDITILQDFNFDTIKIVEDYFKEVVKYHFFWTGVVCIHKKVFQEIGDFNTQLTRGEDLELWLRIGRSFPIIWSTHITAIYQQDSENKATLSKENLKKSVIYYLDFKNRSEFELIYNKQLLRNKIKSLIKQKDLMNTSKLLINYNLQVNWLSLFFKK